MNRYWLFGALLTMGLVLVSTAFETAPPALYCTKDNYTGPDCWEGSVITANLSYVCTTDNGLCGGGNGTADGTGGWTNTSATTSTALNVDITSGNLTIPSGIIFVTSQVRIGTGTTISNNTATIAISGSAQATGNAAVAVGSNARATNGRSIALGSDSKSYNDQSVAIGYGATASGTNSFAMGRDSSATVESAVAIGYGASASMAYSVAVGRSAKTATNSDGVALGRNTQAGMNAVAVGRSANASNSASFAFGYFSKATGGYSVAIGAETENKGTSSVIIGRYSYNEGANTAVAIGYNSSLTGSTHTNSIVLGRDAKSSKTNELVIADPSYPLDGAFYGTLIINKNSTNTTILTLTDADATCLLNPETSGLTTTCSSDEILKEDITEPSFDEINSKISGIVQSIKEYTTKTDGEKHVGPIAQELKKTHPELVVEYHNPLPIGFTETPLTTTECHDDDGDGEYNHDECVTLHKTLREPIFSTTTTLLVKSPNPWEMLIIINNLSQENKLLAEKVSQLCAANKGICT